MTDEEYNNAVPRHYYLRVDGYNKKCLEEQRRQRYDAFFLIAPYTNKGFTWQKYIQMRPLPGDNEPVEKFVMTAEMNETLKNIHAKIKM